MTLDLPADPPTQDKHPKTADDEQISKIERDSILCPHCRRTASNGIKCKGICVADNDY